MKDLGNYWSASLEEQDAILAVAFPAGEEMSPEEEAQAFLEQMRAIGCTEIHIETIDIIR